MLEISGSKVLREFHCSENPLDIFDGYVDLHGARIRCCRRWYGQKKGPYNKGGQIGEYLNSRCIVRGVDVEYSDDIRPFVLQGRLCVSTTMFSPEHGLRSHLLEEQADGSWNRYYLMPPPGIEVGKNWSPFEMPDGRLAFVHTFSPLRILVEIRRETGIILLRKFEAEGIPPDEGDGRFPAHRGGSNGIHIDGKIVGFGHTTRIGRDEAGETRPDFKGLAPQQIHRPFCWILDPFSLDIECFEFDWDWDPRYWIVDPTSFVWNAEKYTGSFFTTETEFSFVDPMSFARVMQYEVKLTKVQSAT